MEKIRVRRFVPTHISSDCSSGSTLFLSGYLKTQICPHIHADRLVFFPVCTPKNKKLRPDINLRSLVWYRVLIQIFSFFQNKMSFEFTIPVARDDLLNRTGVSQYVVDEVLSLREIAGSLQGTTTGSWTFIKIEIRFFHMYMLFY